MAENIGFIGLGVMGKPMAGHLIKAGFRVTVHNRSRRAVDELVAAGATAAATPAEAARASTVVITMLLFVMPRFEGLFHSLGAALPPSTKVLMQMGAAMRSYWWAMLLGAAAAGFF